jgi:hypothetical protein
MKGIGKTMSYEILQHMNPKMAAQTIRDYCKSIPRVLKKYPGTNLDYQECEGCDFLVPGAVLDCALLDGEPQDWDLGE